MHFHSRISKTIEQQRAELPKHRPEPDNSEATSSSNGQQRKRQRQGYTSPADSQLENSIVLIDRIPKTTKPLALNFPREIATGFCSYYIGNQMVTQEKPQSQAQAPQTWDKPTAQASIGDRFHISCMPIMQVIDKDILEDGRVWLLVKPVSGSYTEEWIVQPEPAVESRQQQPAQLEKTELQQPVGFAGDTVSCQLQLTQKSFATYAEWEEATKLIPPGYRLKNGWFYDSAGGRCNFPSRRLSQRQRDILTGKILVR